MSGLVLKRSLALLIVLIGVTTIAFAALRLSGDPVYLLLGQNATPEEADRLREVMGFNRPLVVQYLSYVADAFRGDFGNSLRSGVPVMEHIAKALPVTLTLAAAALGLAVVVAVPIGVIAAVWRGKAPDTALTSMTVLGLATPNFVIGILLILLFAVGLGWFPSSGWMGPRYMVLPAITLATYSIARVSRVIRSSLVEVLSMDYVKSARARGIRESTVVVRHGLRNAIIPAITVVGMEAGVLLGGAVITETIFAVPGLGRLAVDSVLFRDYPVVQGVVIVSAVVVTLVTLIVDVSYMVIDPRIRVQS